MCLRSKSHGKGDGRVLHITRIVARGGVTKLRVDIERVASAVAALTEVATGEVRVQDGNVVGGHDAGVGAGAGRKSAQRDEWRGEQWPPRGSPPPGVVLNVPRDSLAREELPSRIARQDVLSAITSNQVLVLTGETGCGKTTQIPQFCLETALESEPVKPCRIVCTQPRRIAAISVAHRVAHETGTKLGDTVGYAVRLESKRSPETQVLFCTTGLFLKMLLSNPELDGLTHIVLDEVHERDRLC